MDDIMDSLRPRHWLHASRLIASHPATGRSLDLSCPLPPDWPPTA